MIAVALGAATVSMTRPKTATSRHLVRVAALIVSPINQPRPAQGKSIVEVRETYGSTYGDSWYSIAAMRAPVAGMPRCLAAHRTPRPAMTMSEPIHRRCAIQSGTPIALHAEYQGPDGHR